MSTKHTTPRRRRTRKLDRGLALESLEDHCGADALVVLGALEALLRRQREPASRTRKALVRAAAAYHAERPLRDPTIRPPLARPDAIRQLDAYIRKRLTLLAGRAPTRAKAQRLAYDIVDRAFLLGLGAPPRGNPYRTLVDALYDAPPPRRSLDITRLALRVLGVADASDAVRPALQNQ